MRSATAAGVGAYCTARSEAHGLISRSLGDSMALCPPLIISESEIDEMFDRLEKAIDDTESWVAKENLRPAA